MYVIKYWSRFRKDIKNISNKPLIIGKIKDVIEILSRWKVLDQKYKDHSLQWELYEYRECHILPDLLLIYKIDKNELSLYCFRVWSHSDVFR